MTKTGYPMNVSTLRHIDLNEVLEDATHRQGTHHMTGFRAVTITLEEGQSIPLHEEPNATLFIVLGGEGTITVGDEHHRVGAGHIVIAGHGQDRGIECTRRLYVIEIQQLLAPDDHR
jgi:quercetin dioxygenase-like cupin family protein